MSQHQHEQHGVTISGGPRPHLRRVLVVRTKGEVVGDNPTHVMTGDQTTVRTGFRGPQVCKLVGISYRQLDYWARTDLLRPSIADAQGSGSQRLYSYSDLIELKVIRRLLDSGVSLQRARRAIEFLRDHFDSDLATANLVIAGNDSLLVRTGEEVIDLLHSGQGVLNIVPLAPVVAEIDAAVVALRPVAAVLAEPTWATASGS